MISTESRSVIQRAKVLYESQYRGEMERTNFGKFICIEPESRQYFLGDTFDDAVDAALEAFPNRLTFTLKVGQSTALHLGVATL